MAKAIIHNTLFWSVVLEPKYQIGQQVTVKKFKSNSQALRNTEISQYANTSGVVTNYYFIRPNWGNVFYIYVVKIGDDQKDIVLHEDEIK